MPNIVITQVELLVMHVFELCVFTHADDDIISNTILLFLLLLFLSIKL